jgi:hypothetical protein
MSNSFRVLFWLCVVAAVVTLSAQEAQRPEMTARELFYNAGSAPDPKAPAVKKSPGTIVAKKKTADPVTQQAATQSGTAPAAGDGASPADNAKKVTMVSDGARATAPAPTSGTALGLKYTILKLSGDSMAPAAPSTVFHAGDKIQFSIETNGPGYLYIVGQGSSGTWKPMFPAPEIANGSNKVEGFHTYIFPPDHRFVFDQQTGDEKLFIIFSRDPKPDFEQLVYSLQGGKAHPVSDPAPAEQPKQVLRASIDDSTVGRLHQAYARDLVIERVGDDAHPAADNATQEKAVYVVNASGSTDSALVADLHLVHQ